MTFEEFQRLTKNAKVLEQDGHGVKVMETGDARIVKLFRTKRMLSGARLYPYALRFKRNAEKLIELGVGSVQVQILLWQPDIRRHVVAYPKLAGSPLREMARMDAQVLSHFAAFLRELHERGIYFRSLHFGNVLYVTESRRFALIDVADMKIGNDPLGFVKRVRNLRHVCRYAEDRKLLAQFGWENFLALYCEYPRISILKKLILQCSWANRVMLKAGAGLQIDGS